MVFSSSIFLFVFLPLTLLLYYVGGPSRTRKNLVLLFASLVFYAWGEPLFVFVMLLSILINLLAAKKMDACGGRERKIWLIGLIAFDVLLLVVFKYTNFIVENVSRLFGLKAETNIALPIGISFFTFQIMSYVFDVYYGKVPAQKSFVSLALYISMFPQLIAGPIVRYAEIERDIRFREETRADLEEGFLCFAAGLGKKTLLANYLALTADGIFGGDPAKLTVLTAWLGAAVYMLQIYFDFSGYSDMAVGLGRMFGFRFSENFRYPYFASSIKDFWSRWHISLSGWFRDYVYIPLGGSREGNAKTLRNMFVVWLLTGVWHGASWNFIVWGLYYFVLLALEKRVFGEGNGSFFRHALTLALVLFGWVLFRTPSLGAAGSYFLTLFGLNGNALAGEMFRFYLKNCLPFFLFGAVLALPVVPALAGSIRKKENGETLCLVLKSVLTLAVFGFSLLTVVKSGYNPFIYFHF